MVYFLKYFITNPRIAYILIQMLVLIINSTMCEIQLMHLQAFLRSKHLMVIVGLKLGYHFHKLLEYSNVWKY